MRRLLGLFRQSTTVHGQWIEPVLTLRVSCVAAALPWTTLATLCLHQPVWLFWNAVVLVMSVVDDVRAHRRGHQGMDVGRRELLYETLAAWTENRMEPQEYLLRELLIDPEDRREGERVVRRAGKRPSRTPSPERDSVETGEDERG